MSYRGYVKKLAYLNKFQGTVKVVKINKVLLKVWFY